MVREVMNHLTKVWRIDRRLHIGRTLEVRQSPRQHCADNRARPVHWKNPHRGGELSNSLVENHY